MSFGLLLLSLLQGFFIFYFYIALKPAVMAAGGVTQNHLVASNWRAMLAPVADVSYQYYPFVAILAGS